MLGFKRKINRDRAAEFFIEHCHAEATKLKNSFLSLLRAYCDGREGRPNFDAVISRPIVTYEAGRVGRISNTLMDAHCFAITAAVGLNAVRDNIDPPSEAKAMLGPRIS